MTFPTINYKFNGIEEAKSLVEVVEQKLSSLQKFIAAQAAVVCEVEFEKVAAHSHGRLYRVEVILSVNGQLHRVEATENTFEESIDRVRDELDQELSAAKDRQLTRDKAAGRAVKEKMYQD